MKSTQIFCFCQHATNQCISKSTCLQMSRIIPADISTRRHCAGGKHGEDRRSLPPRRNVKGKRIGRVVEMPRPPSRAEPSTCPAGCPTRHEAFTHTRTPLPSAWLHKEGLSGCVCRQDYFRSLHYSSNQTHAGKVLVFGPHTCAQHSETGHWTRNEAIINILFSKKNQTKASMNQVEQIFFYYYEHLFNSTVAFSNEHKQLFNKSNRVVSKSYSIYRTGGKNTKKFCNSQTEQ